MACRCLTKGFKTLEEAKAFAKKVQSAFISTNLPGSRSKENHLKHCRMSGIDPKEYPVIVNYIEF